MTLKVYIDLISQPCRAVYLFLKLTRIPHTFYTVALRKGESRTAQYKENVCPLGLVPALDDDGFKLSESVAMVQYICNTYTNSQTKNLYPTDLEARSKIDAFNSWQHLNLRLGGAYIFVSAVKALSMGGPVDPMMNVGLTALRKSLVDMENIFLKNTPYIYRDHMSIADLIGLCELMQPHYCGIDVFAGYPRVKRWADTVKRDIGQDLFNEAHVYIKKTGALYQSKNLPVPKL